LLSELCAKAQAKFKGLEINVVKIKNEFFGDTVTVAGLVTGTDFKAQLENTDLGEMVLIPRVSLRNEGDKFLDDITVEELSEALKVPVIPVESDGYKLLETIIDGGV
jgi:NifB/MoaA-like Fe-S oxidoreductase